MRRSFATALACIVLVFVLFIALAWLAWDKASSEPDQLSSSGAEVAVRMKPAGQSFTSNQLKKCKKTGNIVLSIDREVSKPYHQWLQPSARRNTNPPQNLDRPLPDALKATPNGDSVSWETGNGVVICQMRLRVNKNWSGGVNALVPIESSAGTLRLVHNNFLFFGDNGLHMERVEFLLNVAGEGKGIGLLKR